MTQPTATEVDEALRRLARDREHGAADRDINIVANGINQLRDQLAQAQLDATIADEARAKALADYARLGKLLHEGRQDGDVKDRQLDDADQRTRRLHRVIEELGAGLLDLDEALGVNA